MENQTKEVNMKRVWISAIIKTLKILLAVVVVFFFCIMSTFFISPYSCAKVFNFMGLTRAEKSCYEYAYNRDKTSASLYNLIIFEMGQGNNYEELYYLNMLLSQQDYDEFYEKLDKSSRLNVKDKSLIVFSCNTNSFVLNQKVTCMFNANMSHEKIINFINNKIIDESMPEYALETYIELILKSNKSDKQVLLTSIENNLFEKLDNKLENLKNLIDNETDEVSKIILSYSVYKNYYAKYLVYNAQGESKLQEKNEAETLYKNAYNNYKNLITKKK